MSSDYNANQNDFYPDWDTVKAFDDRYNDDTTLLRKCLDVILDDENSLNDDDIKRVRELVIALRERLK